MSTYIAIKSLHIYDMEIESNLSRETREGRKKRNEKMGGAHREIYSMYNMHLCENSLMYLF